MACVARGRTDAFSLMGRHRQRRYSAVIVHYGVFINMYSAVEPGNEYVCMYIFIHQTWIYKSIQ